MNKVLSKKAETGPTGPMTDEEVTRKAVLEEVIGTRIQSFREIGAALSEMRASRLYRNEFDTFSDYCREKWDMSKPYAYQVINGANAARNVSAIATIPNEATARELAKLDSKSDQLKAARLLKKANLINAKSAAEAVKQVQARGGLAAQVAAFKSSGVIDVEEVEEPAPKMSTQAKYEAQRTILEWWGKQKHRLQEYPAAPPNRVVELIVELFK